MERENWKKKERKKERNQLFDCLFCSVLPSSLPPIHRPILLASFRRSISSCFFSYYFLGRVLRLGVDAAASFHQVLASCFEEDCCLNLLLLFRSAASVDRLCFCFWPARLCWRVWIFESEISLDPWSMGRGRDMWRSWRKKKTKNKFLFIWKKKFLPATKGLYKKILAGNFFFFFFFTDWFVLE